MIVVAGLCMYILMIVVTKYEAILCVYFDDCGAGLCTDSDDCADKFEAMALDCCV